MAATLAPSLQVRPRPDPTLPDPGGFGADADTPTGSLVPRRAAPRIRVNAIESQETQLLIGKLLGLFNDARAYRRPMLPRWRLAYDMVRNKFWGQGRAGWMPTPEIPEIWPIIDALVGWEMDQQPTYTVAPQAVEHSDFAATFQNMAMNLEAVLFSSYVANSEEVEWAKSNWDKYVYGTGITKTIWDMTLAGGLGDAITRRVTPFAFYPDPAASNLEDANYFVEVKQLSPQDVDRRYPGTIDLFQSGSGADTDIDTPPTQLQPGQATAPTANLGPIPPSTAPRYAGPGSARHHVVDSPTVTLMEFWIREHSTYSATDTNTADSTTRVFDSWRVVVVANGHVLMDEPATNLWTSGKHPYARVVVRDTGEFWGESLVLQLSSAQRSLNRILASIQQNIELTGNPVFKDAGMGRTHVTNRPGQMVKFNNQQAANVSQWMDPPAAHPLMMTMVQYIQSRMGDVSGLTAINKGGGVSGRPSGDVVDSLQEAGFVRIRSSLKFLEAAMRESGVRKADLIAENYTTPRMISVAGPGGERTSITLKSNHFQIPTSRGATPLRFQLLVDVGSQDHTSRAMREDRAIQLFTLGAIDNEALLADVNYPNGQAVAARVQKKQMDMAAAAGDAKAGQPTGKTAARA